MDPIITTLSVLLILALAAVLWLLRERYRLQLERDLARARVADAAEMGTSFQALAGQALRDSNTEFLKLAAETLSAKESGAIKEMEQRRQAVDELIRPIQAAIKETRDQLRSSEKEQRGLREQVQGVAQSNSDLRAETSRLTQALRKPNVRGRYGEVQLERVVELAGMRKYCDFSAQEVLRDADGRVQRPDLVVRLPNQRTVAVDAKLPLDSYMDALEASTDAEREVHLETYAEAVMTQVKRLSSREYWSHFEDSLDLVVMFLPGDQLVDAALERRGDLIDVAVQANVVIASPSTLIGLLRAVHVGWRERNLTEHAEELLRLGREFHQRAVNVLDHAGRLGDSIESTRKAYNGFVGSIESRLLPTLRKFEEQGAGSTKEVSEPRALETETRVLNQVELPDGTDSLFPAAPPPPSREVV